MSIIVPLISSFFLFLVLLPSELLERGGLIKFQKKVSCNLPHADSGVVRIDPLHYLGGWIGSETRRQSPSHYIFVRLMGV